MALSIWLSSIKGGKLKTPSRVMVLKWMNEKIHENTAMPKNEEIKVKLKS